MKYLNLIENHFNMSFENVVAKLHIEKNISVNALCKEVGISHTPFVRIAKEKSIALRSKKEASHINMLLKNPSRDRNNREKRAVTISKTYKDNLLKQEVIFKTVLNDLSIVYKAQEPIGPYNIDFFIEDLNLAIEIDSTDKWGRERRKAAEKRDLILLCEYGIETLRINKRLLKNKDAIINILKNNNVIAC